ncbi:MAG: PHP domain-containing protein [Clostridia bacterium]|nr:PHP domain-containing protein [Clostridia bacterium]
MKFYYDFHIHSCLSPCGDNDMTPCNIVNMAKLSGLDVIALTDHNNCANCEAAVKEGERIGLKVISGMELCTCEEIHIVCLFSNLKSSSAFSDYILSTMPKIRNRPDIFGEQRIMDENDNIIGYQDTLLTAASSVSVGDVVDLTAQYGGICFPAHIDRSSYSVISSLGTITEEMKFKAFEITEKADKNYYLENYPATKAMKSLTDSDAHYLEQLCGKRRSIELPELSESAIIKFFL